MSRLILFCTLANIFLLVASSGYVNDDAERKIAWANTALTGRLLYNKLIKNPGVSDSVAALQILALIAQAALHSEGNQYRELTQWLYMNNKEEITQVFSSIMQRYNNDTSLRSIFTVFGDESVSFSSEFKQNFKEISYGDVKYVNYDNVCHATNRINSWFKDQYNQQAENVIESDYLRNRGNGLVFGAYLYTTTSWDHPFNPKGLVGIDFHKSLHEVQSLVGLYGNAFAKYAELPMLNAKMLMLPAKQEGVQSYILYLYPNDPSELLSILYRVQDPSVYVGAVSQMRDFCLKLHVTIGQAHVTNRYSTYIPELDLNLTDLSKVYKNDYESTHVYSILQQLHFIADKDVRDGPINTQACPNQELPFLKFNHPFAYYVLNKYMSPVYAGVFFGY